MSTKNNRIGMIFATLTVLVGGLNQVNAQQPPEAGDFAYQCAFTSSCGNGAGALLAQTQENFGDEFVRLALRVPGDNRLIGKSDFINNLCSSGWKEYGDQNKNHNLAGAIAKIHEEMASTFQLTCEADPNLGYHVAGSIRTTDLEPTQLPSPG